MTTVTTSPLRSKKKQIFSEKPLPNVDRAHLLHLRVPGGGHAQDRAVAREEVAGELHVFEAQPHPLRALNVNGEGNHDLGVAFGVD